MSSDSPSRTRVKRDRTRARLIQAAADVFGERGFDAARLEDVAKRAGLTTGAIYGNFRSKEDLFLAVMENPASGVDPPFEPGAPLKRQMRILGEAVVAFIPAAQRRGVLFADFQRYVQTHPDMQAEIERRTGENLAQAVEAWGAMFPPAQTGMPLERFIMILDALADGLIAQRLLTPALVPDETIIAAFEALA